MRCISLLWSLVAVLPLCRANFTAGSSNLSLPIPPGSYSVGSKRIELIDKSRLDPFAPSPTPRALMVEFRYPLADTRSLQKAPYFPLNTARYLEQEYSLPNGSLVHIDTHVFLGGPIGHPLLSRDGGLPIILFSPGFGSPEALATVTQEALASWGYIVVGIDHTYDSTPVEFPDGHLVLSTLTTANSTEATIVRAQDVLFITEQLTLENIASWIPGFYDYIEAHHVRAVQVGIYGHSLGGATAALAMQKNTSPIIAGCSLDGPFDGPVLTTGFRGPFFYQGASTDATNYARLVKMWPFIRDWKQAVNINGTSHYDFFDLAVLVPQLPGTALAKASAPLLTAKYPVRELRVISTYLKAFFDFALRGEEEDVILRHEVPEYPEVIFDQL